MIHKTSLNKLSTYVSQVFVANILGVYNDVQGYMELAKESYSYCMKLSLVDRFILLYPNKNPRNYKGKVSVYSHRLAPQPSLSSPCACSLRALDTLARRQGW